MALGGGIYTSENKILPGSYINFVSVKNGSGVFGERGIGAIGDEFDWFESGKIVEVTRETMLKNSLEIFGYDYSHERLMGIRDFFKNGSKLYLYKLNTKNEAYASCDMCTAKKPGKRGNDLRITVENDADSTNKKLVSVYLDDNEVFSQSVSDISQLEKNSFVSWKENATLTLTAGTSLTGGANGTVEMESIKKFLDKLESYYINAVTIISDNEDTSLYLVEYTRRMREEVGKKFQCVIFDQMGQNYEGVVCTSTWAIRNGESGPYLLYWITGALAGCAVNKSLTNKIYDGETEIEENDFSQSYYESKIKQGVFTLHRVNDEIRVLMDINTLTETTDEKGEMFKDNQTIRVIDQIALDIADIFNSSYLGKVPNDKAGRNSLWCDIVKHHEKLRDLRAVEDFEENDITIEQGESKRSVVVYDCITPVNAMAQLYMKVTVE